MTNQLPHPVSSKMSTGQVVDKKLCRADKPLGWGKPSRQVVDIFRCSLDNFARLTERAKTRNRQTQITPEDLPFRLLKKKGKWWLVKLADGTFGWILEKFVKRVKSANYWEKVKLAPQGKVIQLPYPALAKIKRHLKKFEGIPYFWGGATKRGMDCSAFIQKVFLKLFGILLPRNSREQKKCGKFVYSKSICPLDILFFAHSTTGKHHVGVHFGEKVWHFCLDKRGLSVEPLEAIKKRYRYLTARRIINFRKC